ncbi:unnamed protein product [Cylindrotheca closterium]|uniref:Arginyl-tRNA--protein transferase 1 n=1 Tax=Cylindrotheca closterium TaxID=2856 RepID=A0AAD2FZN5_9STRA|nr:unnamed protein product [Cylindrotheca closterium]
MDPIALPSPENVIRPFGYSTSDCGYCKGERAALLPGNVSPNDCSKSWGMLADVMTASAYEGFIAKGWRRSGIHLYKPSNFESCCPTLAIRLIADRFAMTKSQAKVLKKMKNLLQPPLQKERSRRTKQKNVSLDEQLLESCGALSALSECTQQAIAHFLSSTPHASNGNGTSSEWSVALKVRKQSKQERKQNIIQVVSSICAQVAGKLGLERHNVVQTVIQQLILPKTTDFSGGKVSVVGARAHPPSGQIIITLQLLETPSIPADYLDVSMRDESDDSDDKLGAWYYQATHKALLPSQRELTVRTITAYESALDPEAFRLYARYQHVVHNDPDPFSKDSPPKEKGGDEQDEEEIVISELDWGNAPKYFLDRIESTLNALLQGQDQELHNAILSNFYSYYQFLVEAPFPFGDGSVPLQAPACGNYHQHYRIGESLVAVGVVDILPDGFSSVYLYYDPAFSHRLVPLGKYATLKEIEYTHRELQKPYYYLGYYIESCQKMRYKGEYKPSQLLCPKYYQWKDVEIALPKLRETTRHVCAFGDEDDQQQQQTIAQNDIRNHDYYLGQIQMDIGAGMNVVFDMLQESGKDVVKPILEEFMLEAGSQLPTKCLVKLT